MTKPNDLHYNYTLQCWVRDGIIIRCEHTESMRRPTRPCCNASRFDGMTERAAEQIHDANERGVDLLAGIITHDMDDSGYSIVMAAIGYLNSGGRRNPASTVR